MLLEYRISDDEDHASITTVVKVPFELVPDFSRRIDNFNPDIVATFGITEQTWREDAIKLVWNLQEILNDKLALEHL